MVNHKIHVQTNIREIDLIVRVQYMVIREFIWLLFDINIYYVKNLKNII